MHGRGFETVGRVGAIPTTRRQALKLLATGSALGVAATMSGARVMAQAGTPSAASYPVVSIVGVDYGYQMPSTFPGGYTRVTLKNDSQHGMTHTALFLQPLPGKTAADIEAALKAAPTAADIGKIFAVATSIGGPASIDPGETSTVIMNLAAGQYVVFCPIPDDKGVPHYAMGMRQTVTVTAEAAMLPAPTADLTVDLADFKFEMLPDTVPAGNHIWEVTNKGPQIHEMSLFRLAPGFTAEQFKALLLSSGAPATPEASPMAGMAMGTPMAMASPAASPAGAPPAIAFGGVGAMNPGNTVWAVLDLQPGDEVAICFVPDQKTGIPHFAEGMFMGFTVK